MISFLILEVGMIGVFIALDLFLFYIFWEIVLVPMYLIIGIWGGANRIYATIKFVLYTLVGSLLMLVAILATAFTYQAGHGGSWVGRLRLRGAARLRRRRPGSPTALQLGGLPGLLPGLRDQGPDVPVPHLAAGRAHRGPDRGLGDPGRRSCSSWAPTGSSASPCRSSRTPPRRSRRSIIVLSLIAIIYGAIVALVQPDLKRLVAYSSVSHMGFVTLGIFVFTEQGIQGAILQMINHGLITGALFLLVGVIYERTHDRTIAKMGGLAARTPVYAAVFGFFVFASAGLPGLSGFVGEFLVLVGHVRGHRRAAAAIATFVMVLAAGYLLYMYGRIVFGEVSDFLEGLGDHLTDMTPVEILTLVPLGALVVVFGIQPGLLLDLVQVTVAETLEAVQPASPIAIPAEVVRRAWSSSSSSSWPASAGSSGHGARRARRKAGRPTDRRTSSSSARSSRPS